MSIVIDQQYAGMLAPYVRNFRRKGRAYNFSCPVCGDSATNQSRARGYLYPKGDTLVYSCHNCNTPIHRLGGLLQHIDGNLAEQYRTDTFLEKSSPPVAIHPSISLSKFGIDSSLQKISTLRQGHPAKTYVESRMIPSNVHYLLYYVEEFKKFCNKIDPTTYKEIYTDEPRLVIPLLDKNGNVNGYQGRSLDTQAPLKYITVLTHASNLKYFGLDRLDPNQNTIVLEGPIDALFLSNAIATAGGRLDTGLEAVGVSKDRSVVVYDNEPRSIHTISKMEKAIHAGFSVCFWPEKFGNLTDINAMVLAGYTSHDLQEIIFANSYSGLRGTLELSAWRKVDSPISKHSRGAFAGLL